jgi:hypothetical protein
MSNCTKCGMPGAYLGLVVCECRNPSCTNFKAVEVEVLTTKIQPVLRSYSQDKPFVMRHPETSDNSIGSDGT